MDISLNTVVTVPPKHRLVKEKVDTEFKHIRQNKFRNQNDFSFEFKKNDKIKAVARRRTTKNIKDESTTVENNLGKLFSSEKSKRIAQNTSKPIIPTDKPVKRNFVMRPQNSDSNDEQNDKVDDIMLGIINDPKAQIERKKISRSENRFSNRKGREHRNNNVDRVLTEKEVNDGIKKFSQIPNKFKPLQKQTKNIKKPIENLFENNPEAKIIGQRLVKPIREKVFTGISLESLGLHPHCVKNLSDILNVTQLTTVQKKTIPHALANKDLLVRSQTGSGKTLAYALPMVDKLQKIRPKFSRIDGIFAVIVVPTRELSIQTYELLIKLLKPYQWIVPGFLTGGEKRKAEKARLRKGINILVGTPGRLVDHLLHTESFKLDKIQMLILDEADRLLEMGYERDVRQIVEAISDHRQGIFKRAVCVNDETNGESIEIKTTETFVKCDVELQSMLLSATLTSAVQKLAGLTLKNPLFIDNSDEDPSNLIKSGDEFENTVQQAVDEEKLVIPENLNLNYVLVPPKLRLVTLSGLLAKNKKKLKAVIFMATTEMVNFHHDILVETLTSKILDDEDDEQNDNEIDRDEQLLTGMRFFKLHGSMTQLERGAVFRAFRDAKTGVLLATDVVGRGIDVPEIDLVIQYSPPQKICDFVHRVGRTARAGRSGQAVLFLGPGEIQFIRMLEDKRIRISQILMEEFLKPLLEFDTEANTTQKAASNLQNRFEELILEDMELRRKGEKAFVSWLKNYSTFPRELKPIFNAKVVHSGHFAKSFGLRDPPNNFARYHTAPKAQQPVNRLTYTKRDQHEMKADKKPEKRTLGTRVNFSGNRTGGRDTTNQHNNDKTFISNKLHRFSQKSMALGTSEFDSGIPAKKKKN